MKELSADQLAAFLSSAADVPLDRATPRSGGASVACEGARAAAPELGFSAGAAATVRSNVPELEAPSGGAQSAPGVGSADSRRGSTNTEGDWVPDELATLDFKSGAELAAFFDDNLNKGIFTLHPWQVEVNELLANAKADSLHPFKYVLCAANGSGKDFLVIAPFVMWFLVAKKRASVIVTSASGTQLTAQTELYVRNLAIKINAWYKAQFGIEILKIRQRYFKCLLSGSECRMFATDEEGRAEGYHPIEPGAHFAIIVNEAKSVAPEIFRALRRCTGFTHWINVSTPGLLPAGDFYNSWCYWPNKRRVTYYDCPHQSPDEFETDKREIGEHSALFRSKWLALFTTADGDTVIPGSALERLKLKIKTGQVLHRCKHWPIRIGIDLAAGGDENSVVITHGTKVLELIAWRERDTTHTVERLLEIFDKHSIPKEHDYIFADDGGIGRAIIDMLRKAGYVNIKRVLNQSPPKNKSGYRNRGAELWYNLRRLIEDGLLLLPLTDLKLWDQLATRRLKKVADGASVVKVQLESKAAARAEGLPSPDRADSLVLAFCGVTISEIYDDDIRYSETKPKSVGFATAEALEQHVENCAFDEAFNKTVEQKKYVRSSLRAHLKQSKKYDRRSRLLSRN